MATASKAKTAAKPVKKAPPRHTFTWEGKDKAGKKIRGETIGQTPQLVKAQLKKQGISTTSFKKKAAPRGRTIQPADIALFTRQLATMMKAGVPLVQSFELVSDGADNANMKALIDGIRDEVSAGGGFASALRKHPKYFDDLFCSLIDSGEQAGALETMLDRVATYKEKTEALKAKIKKALTYPISVLVVAFVVTAILLVKVVPTFAVTFQSFGAQLPAFTLFVLHLSELMQQYWLIICIGAGAGAYGFSEMRRRSKTFSDRVDAALLKAPAVGGVINMAVVARFARTLSTTFAAGVPLVEALNSVAGAAGNAVYRDAIYNVRDAVTSGVQMNVAMRQTGVFPTLLLQMTSIGEESGALDSMLEKAALHYEAAVDDAVDNLTALLEPMIMSVLGVLVGGLMIAMYMPIFMLGSVV
jgi:type IV pilus assembly protein PilC